MSGVDDPRFLALVDVVRRTGAKEFQIRYSDDEEPTVWMAVVGWDLDRNGRPVAKGGRRRHEAAAGMTPLAAIGRLAERIMDGGECAHCHRPTAVSDDWTSTMPLEEHICWFVYDPELKTFRRSCEGAT
jgi:hypothetical protein